MGYGVFGLMQYDDISKLPIRYQQQILRKLAEQEAEKPAPAQEPAPKKSQKFHNQVTEEQGIRFDSKKEARRYRELMEQVRLGEISDLRLQVNFTLQEGYTKPDGERVRPMLCAGAFYYKSGNRCHKTWILKGGKTMAEETNVNTTGTGTGIESQETRTFTQEELNTIVQDRLNRERGKYADYDTLKDKASKWDAAEEEGKTELQKAQERVNALQQKVAEYEKSETLRNIRVQVSQETGVPVDLLFGETKEACMEQAQGILKYAKPEAYPQVKDGGSPGKKTEGSTRDLFASYFNSVMK